MLIIILFKMETCSSQLLSKACAAGSISAARSIVCWTDGGYGYVTQVG